MRLVRRFTVRGLAPRPAAVVGAALVVVVGLLGALLDDSLGHAGQALLLVVPVTVTAVLGGRLPGLLAAAAATLALTLLLPPVGTLRVHFAEDVVALVVFSVVAFTISNLVAHRIEVLEAVERQRAVLLRSVSHDLRTPLATIRAAVSELEDGPEDGPGHDEQVRQRMLALVGNEAERLDRFVANLLSLARIEAGGLRPKRQAVDLVEVVEVCVDRLGRALTGTEVIVESPDPPGGLPLVLADHVLIEQVVTNLVENAVRHGPPGGPVTVTLLDLGWGARLEVADAGPGIPEAQWATIFEPFQGATPGTGSTGVGLAICKALVEAHAGTITVRGSPAGGTVFTIELPRR